MFKLLARNALRLIVLSSLFFVPALAQFEVAPDHFDSAQKNGIPKNVAKTTAKTAQPATVPGVAVAPGSAGAATIRGRHKSGTGAGQTGQRLQPRRNMQRNLSGNQVVAARQKHSDKARTVATLQ